ncbi:hypothetical protein N0M98_13575 [Paenibacillus doosanensis]|uniref:hypothetical protein n=1 Tax=Paenibacillus doosanensis TaxID=1229154 RepID=UPI0021800A85|nr:hypothetical protein [Paenibacillus doosanensis]MCS7461178.1 hypothetical protein [Paenibacillus doosanensis]
MTGKNSRSDKLVPITLPYDFVPFPENGNDVCRYPYAIKGVPKHNAFNNGLELLSGQIRYRITPCSDLVIEARAKRGGGYFISGSQLRGKVRANVAILSGSDPKFINRSPMLYRDFTRGTYRNIILKGSTLERAVKVGFLRKNGDKFYVVPTQSFGERNFVMLKEHWLIQQKAVLKRSQQLFDWKDKALSELEEFEKKIKQITDRINVEKEKLAEKYDKVKEGIRKVFEQYGFTKSPINWNELNKFGESLNDHSKAIMRKLRRNASHSEFDELFRLMIERWRLKAHIHRIYSNQSGNSHYTPYQQNVDFRLNAYGGVECVRLSMQNAEKGYLYNSTKVGTKRSHYLIGAPKDDHQGYEVKQATIDGYNQNFKKFRVIENKEDERNIKLFYNIFSDYENCSNQFRSVDGLVVFYQIDDDGQMTIGRTPYFKIPYYHQLNDLLGNSPEGKVDYEDALFGFAPNGEGQEREASYKSRLRFEPIDIPEDAVWGRADFLLPTPQASAERMYLRPNGRTPATYEKVEKVEQPKPKLNGYKYYHVLGNVLEKTMPTLPKDKDAMLSRRNLLKKETKAGEPYTLKGTISFTNVHREELGLLLLGLDLKLLRHSRLFKEQLSPYYSQLEEAYELIGGAKPYGYGKVKIHVDSIALEKQGTDFDSLVVHPVEIIEGQENFHSYVDAFMDRMKGADYFQTVHLGAYIRSKQEFIPEHSKLHINWNNMQEQIQNQTRGYKKKGGGYPKEWMLSSLNHDEPMV